MNPVATPSLAALYVRKEPGRVDPADIERSLRALAEDASAGERTVRACMSNLMIYCDDEKQAERVPPQLGALARQHPARILLMVGESAALASGIAAEVSSLCYVGSAGRSVCAEHVRLDATHASRQRLPATVRPLLVADLPTALWWATPEPPSASEIFRELEPMADQVVYDSAGWRDPARGVMATANFAGAARGHVTDLAWSRLLPWRRLIAETLDPSRLPGALGGIRALELEHGPHGLPKAWLLIGWLAHALGWQLRGASLRPGIDIAWSFESETGPVRATLRRLAEGSPEIHALAIHTRAHAGELRVRIAALDAERLSVQIEGASALESVVPLPPLATVSLLAAQLSDRSIDAQFRAALATSRELVKAAIR